MFKKGLLMGIGAIVFGMNVVICEGETEIVLKDNTANSGFSVKEEVANGTLMRVLGMGNMGIGTANPTEKLEVIGNVKATRFIGDGSGLTGILSGSPSQWTTTGTNISYSAGNVGIGTTGPGSKLTVAGMIESTSDGIKFPDGTIQSKAATLKTYDSGWFAISTNTTYSKTHSLGTTKVIVAVYVSNASDNSGWVLPAMGANNVDNEYRGTAMVTLTTTTCSIRTLDYLCRFKDASGTDTFPTTGFARIIMLALE